jgi:hypothetical protein
VNLALAVLLAVLLTPVAHASAAVPQNIGYDISYPQCGSAFPADARFAIAGVTAGRPGDPNPCLADQMRWGSVLPGYGIQPGMSLYMNTANPGLLSPSWPHDGVTPYGVCDGTETSACAFEYGRFRAVQAFGFASSAALVPVVQPAAAPWWLDVETANTWSADAARNIAALHGFIAGLAASGVTRIGLYSNVSSWQTITGDAGPASFGPLPVWVPGAGDEAGAAARCDPSYSFSGGPVLLTQYPRSGFDGDHACP